MNHEVDADVKISVCCSEICIIPCGDDESH